MHDGTVDVGAVVVGTAAVAVEQRVENLARQRGRQHQRIALQRAQHQRAQRGGGGAVLRQLLVLFDAHGLRAGAVAAVAPRGIGCGEQRAALGQLVGGEQVLEVDQHEVIR